MTLDILQPKAKRILAAALIIWLSGVVVLFCCEMPANAAADQIESCPLAKKGKCTKTSAADEREFFGQIPPALDCCDFPARIFDKARKLETAPEPFLETTAIKIAAPQRFIVRETFKFPAPHQSFIRNRGGTYLQNRVFRI